MPELSGILKESIAEHLRVIEALNEQLPLLERIAGKMGAAIAAGKKILWFGNGGSAAAMALFSLPPARHGPQKSYDSRARLCCPKCLFHPHHQCSNSQGKRRKMTTSPAETILHMHWIADAKAKADPAIYFRRIAPAARAEFSLIVDISSGFRSKESREMLTPTDPLNPNWRKP